MAKVPDVRVVSPAATGLRVMTVASSVTLRTLNRPSNHTSALTGEELSSRKVSAVVAMILRHRLFDVLDAVPPAVQRWHEDVEHVHALRVATRRASSALKAFGDLLPPRKAKRLRKELSQLRKAAGEARDLDVLYMRLERDTSSLSEKRRVQLLKFIARRRVKAQNALVNARTRLQDIKLPRQIKRLLKRVRWRAKQPEPTYRTAIDGMVECAAAIFLTEIERDIHSVDKIHELRIHAKQLRYVLDLEVDTIRKHQHLYRAIKQLQNRLGDLNDHDVARLRLLSWSKQANSGERQRMFKSVSQRCKRAAKQEIKKFRQRWPQEQQELRALLLDCNRSV